MIHYDFIGIDMAKSKLNTAFQLGHRWVEAEWCNDQEGHKRLLEWINRYTKNAFICLEATGCYGETLAEYLVERGIKVSIVNPMQIKHYAKSLLSRNKNDRVDAKIIASYAEKFIPRCFAARTTRQKLIQEGIQLMDTWNEQKCQLANQLESVRSKEIRREMEKTMQYLVSRITKLEESVNKTIGEYEAYAISKQRLLKVIGIGEKTANRLVACLPDVSNFHNAKQLAAYVGVCPKQHQSGKYQGKTRLSKCGNAQLRKALYMPALVAKNNNPHLKAFCLRLEKNGLKPKQIICAVMRKLIHIIFGILKHQQDFNPALV